jgi:adenine phosphoribosyltransferase
MGLANGDPVKLPLVRSDDGFCIYALDLMGRAELNFQIAKRLKAQLNAYNFDIILTAEAKAIALAQALAEELDMPEYVVLRKSLKLYMLDPITVEVQSITTQQSQHFYLGADRVELLRGKRICVLDDVLSTGGTMQAILQLTAQTNCTVEVIAVILTEEKEWEEFDGIPVVSLGHIPLPGFCE